MAYVRAQRSQQLSGHPKRAVLARKRRTRGAQSTVETMLLTSVIVVAVAWVAGDGLWPKLADGLQAMQDRISAMSEDGVVDGH